MARPANRSKRRPLLDLRIDDFHRLVFFSVGTFGIRRVSMLVGPVDGEFGTVSHVLVARHRASEGAAFGQFLGGGVILTGDIHHSGSHAIQPYALVFLTNVVISRKALAF